MADPRYWLGFHLTKGIGPARLERLLAYFGDLGEAWEADPRELERAGLGEALRESLAATRREYDLDRELARLERAGVTLLTWDDGRYPQRLRQIAGAPPVLYVKGELTAADELALAVVGTRRATSYGREVTARLAGELAEAGLDIIGISPDPPENLLRFREKENLGITLVSDPDKEVLRAYGAYGPKKLYGKEIIGVIRSTFVVDAEGRIEKAAYNVKATGHVAKLRRELGLG